MSSFMTYTCPNCGESYSCLRTRWKIDDERCLKCHEKLEAKFFDSEEFPELYERMQKEEAEYYELATGTSYSRRNEPKNVPKCPTCQSTNVSKISDLRKVANIAMFGIFGQTRKCQFECKDCGYKW